MAEQQKVTIVAAYLNDVGDAWYQKWMGVKDKCSWEEFVEGLCGRFGEKGMLNVVEEFNKLRQGEFVRSTSKGLRNCRTSCYLQSHTYQGLLRFKFHQRLERGNSPHCGNVSTKNSTIGLQSVLSCKS